jgi:thiamine biosynthesis lipoprotein
MALPATTTCTREARFSAMGTSAHVVVVGGRPPLLARAQARIADLEGRWSRFRPDSELNRVNASAGRPVVVSTETFDLIARAVAGWEMTRGRFDPSVLPAVRAAGYDRDFAAIERVAVSPADPPSPAPGCAPITLDPVVSQVTLPPGVALDSGGIGKGLAADLGVEKLRAGGAAGACVNIGGDLRVDGEGPGAGSWVVAVDGPRHPPVLSLATGGVATSSRLRRRWWRAGRALHHIIDPVTGAPADTPLGSATVIAGDAWRAEVLATAVLVAGGRDQAARLVETAGATGLVVAAPGAWYALPGLEPFLS